MRGAGTRQRRGARAPAPCQARGPREPGTHGRHLPPPARLRGTVPALPRLQGRGELGALPEEGQDHHRRAVVPRAREDPVVPGGILVARSEDGLEEAAAFPSARRAGEQLDGLRGLSMPVVEVIGSDAVRPEVSPGLPKALFQLVPVGVEGLPRCFAPLAGGMRGGPVSVSQDTRPGMGFASGRLRRLARAFRFRAVIELC